MKVDRFNKIEKITFQKKPISISANYRPFYKISQIALVLKLSSRTSKASLLKLHFFSWILKSKKRMDQVIDYVKNDFQGKLAMWRIDPRVNRALEFGIADKIFKREKGNYILTKKGDRLINFILDNSEIFKKEKIFLTTIGKKISETKIDIMIDSWKREII